MQHDLERVQPLAKLALRCQTCCDSAIVRLGHVPCRVMAAGARTGAAARRTAC